MRFTSFMNEEEEESEEVSPRSSSSPLKWQISLSRLLSRSKENKFVVGRLHPYIRAAEGVVIHPSLLILSFLL